MNKDLEINGNIAVHCPTEELARKVLKITGDLICEWTYESFKRHEEQTCYRLHQGQVWGYASKTYYENAGCNIISAKKFIELHNKEDDRFTMYCGDNERGEEIIQLLQNSGANNPHDLDGRIDNAYYYINKHNNIAMAVSSNLKWLLKRSFELKSLPVKEVKFKATKGLPIIVRNADNEKWKCTIFCSSCLIFNDNKLGIINDREEIFSQFIPFNDNNMRFIETTNKPSIDYRII